MGRKVEKMIIILQRLTKNQILYIGEMAKNFGTSFTEMHRRLLDEIIEIKKEKEK